MSLCKKCQGSGQASYPNSATWDKRPHVISQRVIRWDTCDLCWGSGDELAPGTNLLEQRAEAANRVTQIGLDAEMDD